ncbi:hypothetical protein LR48_Vigan10g130900 [Vigna angularis]|uniref:Uncharacterized protein n=1 Tax=Phaseolus angularis TaxID=3914 RepID=A0A0L9VKH2_PHAAN|nr:hypothetical protein LR48_Vigan10g130900 [Vigna angularis]
MALTTEVSFQCGLPLWLRRHAFGVVTREMTSSRRTRGLASGIVLKVSLQGSWPIDVQQWRHAVFVQHPFHLTPMSLVFVNVKIPVMKLSLTGY